MSLRRSTRSQSRYTEIKPINLDKDSRFGRRKESEPCKCKELIKAKDEEIKKLQFEIAELQQAIEDRRDYIFVDKLSINAEAEYVFV